MDMYALILNEFGVYLPEDAPVLHLMHLSSVAATRRNDRIKAAQEGRNYVG